MLKLLLIGDSAVGKTCILLRFSDDRFDTSHINTIGIDFKTKEIEANGQRVNLQVWDTAGQERFRVITHQYYRGAMGILVVYDVTNAKSFKNVADWLRQIEDHASEDVVKILVGNKSDKTNKRVVSRERGEMLALEHGMKFYETSAKLNTNIDKAFYEMADTVLARKRESQREEPKRDTVVPGTSAEQLLEKYVGGCC